MTISPISLAFKNCKKEKRPALITFTVAGDNTKKNSLKILNSIAKHADILELSFLHNCPIADGGQIVFQVEGTNLEWRVESNLTYFRIEALSGVKRAWSQPFFSTIHT